jgi:hypothetical protein
MTPSEAEHIFTDDLYQIRSGVLVVLGTPWTSLQQSDIELLHKILNAVKLSLAGVTIVESTEINDALLRTYQPHTVLGFGTASNLPIISYQATNIGEAKIILADAIDKLTDENKKELWGELKKIFL